jgi:Fur family peroxide stress response transcriptional regulator
MMDHDNMDAQQRLSEIALLLKEHGCRMTPQRMAILRVLTESRSHPTIDEIYGHVRKDFPMTSLATVYKTVALLSELGQVTELGVPGGASRFDGASAEAHPHITCVRCGRIADVELPRSDAFFDAVAGASQFQVVEGRVDFWGVCPACQQTV